MAIHTLVPIFISLLIVCIHSTRVPFLNRQSGCSNDNDCNAGLVFPSLTCRSRECFLRPSSGSGSSPGGFGITTNAIGGNGPGSACFSIRDCRSGLVCVSGNPRGTCQTPQGVLDMGHLLQNLIQEDYTFPPGSGSVEPEQQGPTRASRAMAIMFLAAHDAYGALTGAFSPKISSSDFTSAENSARSAAASSAGVAFGLSNPAVFNTQAEIASFAAGLNAAKLLYPRSTGIIDGVRDEMLDGGFEPFIEFGDTVAEIWIRVRRGDGSSRAQLDNEFVNEFIRHQPDPNYELVTGKSGSQPNFGRNWARVTPFVVSNIRRDAFLGPFPVIVAPEYVENLREVEEKGQCNSLTLPSGGALQDIGVFWGYDGMPEIGVPPRLYLQVILAVQELKTLSFANQLRALSGVNVAMADAGIAAWLWKFVYDLWRPVVGIRGDPRGNSTWSPIGVAFSNIGPRTVPLCEGLNPDFPAYPSGHASFGSAAFRVLAALLGKSPKDIQVRFTSDEFNGRTVDGVTGRTRRVFTQRISLDDAIEQNKDSRVFLGVHWRFDSDGGDIVGTQVANMVANAFRFV